MSEISIHNKNTYTLRDLMQKGYTAVVTGASSGIGKAACLQFAAEGMNVFMIDNDAKELAITQKICKAKVARGSNHKQFVLAEVIDVTDEKAMTNLAIQVFESTSKCHILMNNAGIGLGGGALTNISTVERVMGVNTYGPINGCLAFIQRMKDSNEPGIIINTGSKQGITMPPGNLTYNMSKAALKVYTEGLEHELMLDRFADKCKIRAVLLIPGWVNTSMLYKTEREKAKLNNKECNIDDIFFHEEKPQKGAWMPNEIIDYLKDELDNINKFYVICPDNETDNITDKIRIHWTMNDIIYERPPLSRWHPSYKEQYNKFLEQEKEKYNNAINTSGSSNVSVSSKSIINVNNSSKIEENLINEEESVTVSSNVLNASDD